LCGFAWISKRYLTLLGWLLLNFRCGSLHFRRSRLIWFLRSQSLLTVCWCCFCFTWWFLWMLTRLDGLRSYFSLIWSDSCHFFVCLFDFLLLIFCLSNCHFSSSSFCIHTPAYKQENKPYQYYFPHNYPNIDI